MPGVGSFFGFGLVWVGFFRISYPLFPLLTKKVCLLVPLRLLSPLSDRYWGYSSQCCVQHQRGSDTGLGCATFCAQEAPVTLGARSASEDPVGDVGMRLSPCKVSSLQPVCHTWKQASLTKKKCFLCSLSTGPACERQGGGIIQLLTAPRGPESRTLH